MELLGGGRTIGLLRRPLRGFGHGLAQIEHALLERALPAPQRLRHRAPHLAGQEEAREPEDHEGGPPIDGAGHRPADDEAKGTAGYLAAQDVGVYPATLGGGKVVTGQGCDRRAGRGRDRTEQEPR